MSNPKTNRGCRFFGCLIAVVSLLSFAMLLTLVVGRNASARRQLTARLDELKAAGVPVDPASLQTFFEAHTNPQDTARWQAVIKTLRSEGFSQSAKGVPFFDGSITDDVPLPGEEWDSEVATRRFLSRWEDFCAEVQELASHAEPVRFPLEFNGESDRLDLIQNLRQAARLLLLQGQVALFDLDSDSLQRISHALLGMSRVTAGDPILMSQLVGVACDGMALDLLKAGVQSGVLQTAELKTFLPDLVAHMGVSVDWQIALFGERAWMLPIFEGSNMAVPVAIPGRGRDALLYSDIIDRCAALWTKDLHEFRVGLKQIEEELQQSTSGSLLTRFDSLLTATMTPNFSGMGDAFVRRAILHRQQAVAIGVRIYEQEKGLFPQSLPNLSELQLGLEELCPYDNQQFGYRIRADGVAQIWSFNLRNTDQVPAEPPNTTVGTPSAEENSMWVWELQPTSK